MHQPLTKEKGSCLKADEESQAAHSQEECDEALRLVADRNCFEAQLNACAKDLRI